MRQSFLLLPGREPRVTSSAATQPLISRLFALPKMAHLNSLVCICYSELVGGYPEPRESFTPLMEYH